MMTLSPPRLADAVRRRLEKSAHDVNAYWVSVAEEREAYAAALCKELYGYPIVVTVIRDSRFNNPNALLDDFAALVGEYRGECEDCLHGRPSKCGFVLLSRTELTVPQISSPVVLPPWFPVGGGKTVSMLIEDITWTADAPLAASEVKIGELSEHLLELEEVILLRISTVKDHRKTSGFVELIRQTDDEKLNEILDAASEHRASVTTPSAFRPSLRDGRSFIARLWKIAQTRHSEDMTTPSKLLAEALALPDRMKPAWHESLPSVLRRPSGGEPSERLRFARNVLLTVGTACQLMTAAAHSDAYQHYPVVLLRAVSFDLRRALADAENVLRSLSE